MSIDPHANAPEEDPEEHIGEEIPDPWEDHSQEDWPTDTRNLADEVQAGELDGDDEQAEEVNG